MQCVILGGGLGTRIASLGLDVPKALIPVAGKPFAHHQLELLARHGIDEVVYSIGFRGDQIRDDVGDGRRFGLRVRYVDEGTELRGTAGALRLALDEGVLAGSFFVLYGDSYLPIEYQPVWDAFTASGKPGLMTVFRNLDQWDRSNVLYEEGRVIYDKTRQHARSAEMAHIDYGLSALSRTIIAERVPRGVKHDLATVFHGMSIAGELAGYLVTQRFYEIGSVAGLRDLEQHIGAFGPGTT